MNQIVQGLWLVRLANQKDESIMCECMSDPQAGLRAAAVSLTLLLPKRYQVQSKGLELGFGYSKSGNQILSIPEALSSAAVNMSTSCSY